MGTEDTGQELGLPEEWSVHQTELGAVAPLLLGRGMIDLALLFGRGVLVEAAALGGDVIGQTDLFRCLTLVTPALVVSGRRRRGGQPVSAVWPRIRRWV